MDFNSRPANRVLKGKDGGNWKRGFDIFVDPNKGKPKRRLEHVDGQHVKTSNNISLSRLPVVPVKERKVLTEKTNNFSTLLSQSRHTSHKSSKMNEISILKPVQFTSISKKQVEIAKPLKSINNIMDNVTIRQSDTLNVEPPRSKRPYLNYPLPKKLSRTSTSDVSSRDNSNNEPKIFVTSLQKYLCDLDTMMKTSKKFSYDSVWTINSITKLSDFELQVTTQMSPQLIILHNKTSINNIPILKFIHDVSINTKIQVTESLKLAINSKSFIKVSDDINWYIDWKFIPSQ
ncbi:hypothetical protein NCAS_0G00210 [Naumovozyma castellii]|uniref:Uncharacterized protein n=1 Tax=Naumovozyma castellii TaxID=27288 RepID=G0VHM4_NAUCA|nr:hypothetical protein NCAS_0G00210 [Naumovozyma castellii CBS 4309]CCC70908.1 hypothetical protein NCAS_0G00210 [Naumovozyma castellii CBS 4309]